ALWRDRGAAARWTLVVRGADGKTRKVRVPARSRAEFTAAVDKAPKQLDLSWTAREARLLDDGVAYLRPGPFYNAADGATDLWDATAFAAFIDQSFQRFIDADAKALVIDLRDNPGGDNSFSDRMIAWFADRPWRFASSFRIKVSRGAIDTNAKRVPLEKDPNGTAHRFAAEYAKRKPGDVFAYDLPEAKPRDGARFAGKVYLLINRHSYSNTANVAALAQDLDFATIVGEETSDLATTYGAMEQFELPNTGIVVGFPKAHIMRMSGDTAPRGVVPDIAIATPLPEPVDDVVLRKAVDIASGKIR
ncbi:MAG TPA: S41 family peptidase, partial [Tahibacter sp.]|nr:S41 family peptidase [Tahibacter sp.]